jgi:hypothetical protein
MLGAGDFRRPYAEERLGELKRQVAFVRIVVEGPRHDAVRVVGDGVELGPASVGIELSVDPGAHVFFAAAPGFSTERVVAELARAEHRDVVLRLSPLPAPRTSDVDRSKPRPSPKHSSVVPFVVMGTGAATIIAGAVSGLVVMNAASDVKDHCDATGCAPAGLDAARAGRPFAILSPILLAMGAALAGAGVVWWRLSRRNTTAFVLPLSVAGTF